MIFEYFGLPATGKSWHLGESGLRSERGAIGHSVPVGGGLDKTKNTILGVLKNKRLFLLLIYAGFINLFYKESIVTVRPFLVVFERLGRIECLTRIHSGEEVHIDEGGVQFLWRVFSEFKINNQNLRTLRECIKLILINEGILVYFTCPKSLHTLQIIDRQKTSSHFDKAVINNNMDLYQKGRTWMAYIIKFIKAEDQQILLLSR